MSYKKDNDNNNNNNDNNDLVSVDKKPLHPPDRIRLQTKKDDDNNDDNLFYINK